MAQATNSSVNPDKEKKSLESSLIHFTFLYVYERGV